MSKIFFSHASKDKPVVDLLVNTFLLSCGLSADDIFYTSVSSTGCTGGALFNEEIRANFRESKVIIAYLSKNYRNSAYCMAELGATWFCSNEKIFIPLLDDSIDDIFFGGVLSGITLQKIDNQDSLMTAIERIFEAFGKQKGKFAWIFEKVSEFLDNYPAKKKEIPIPFECDEKKFTEIKTELDKYKIISQEQLQRIKEDEILIKKIKEAKDSKDIHKAEMEACADEFEKLDMAIQNVHKSAKKLNAFMEKYVIYDFFGVDPCYRYSDYSDEYQEALNDGYLEQDDNNDFFINDSDRQVDKVKSSLGEFYEVIQNLKESTIKALEDHYDINFDLHKGTCLKAIFGF